MKKCNVLVNGNMVTLETIGDSSVLLQTAKAFFKKYKPVSSSRMNGVLKLTLKR